MKEIKLTQVKVALVDDEDFEYLNQFKWAAHKSGKTFYADAHERGNHDHIIKMHRLIMNTPSHLEVDHIDHNGLNNQKVNLRNCTRSENIRNSPIQKNNVNGYTGVYIRNRKNKKKTKVTIHAVIYHNKKGHYLGNYKTKIEAAIAYDKKAKEFFGEFARLNFSVEPIKSI
jgi:hypothetical protein